MGIINKKLNRRINRIGIDARLYGPLGKGIGRYVREIVDHIIKIDTQNEYVIFLSQENFHEFAGAGRRIKKVLAIARSYTLAEQIVMPWLIWREKLDLIHFPHFNAPIFAPGKFVITIHDLISIKFPADRTSTLPWWLYKIKNISYRLVIWLTVKRAKKVIAVSEYTKKDIIKQFKVNPKKIAVTYEGVAELSKTPFNHGGKGGFIGQPYLLYIGNAYPHKNLDGLIRVFSEINKNLPDLKLVLVGKEDYFYSRLKQFAKKFSDHIIFPGYVPDRELAGLYQNALVYVFPSFYEGFGLPPLEAMAHGLTVVSSNKTCLPEILGDAALYFNPDDEADMKYKIEGFAI